jgi:hypothetical protein
MNLSERESAMPTIPITAANSFETSLEGYARIAVLIAGCHCTP